MNRESNCDIAVGDCLAKIARQPKVKTTDYLESGAFPVIDQGTKFVGGYVNDESLLYTGPLPVVIFGDHNRHIKFVKSPFAVGADGTQLLYPDERFEISYFYYAIRALPLKNYGYERHFKYLKEERLRAWPLDGQRRIAAILSAYDDLIENNTRRIAILEEMARRIYEEWFVRFRFPGHEGVRMIESELGLVPDRWEHRSLAQFGDVITGKTPSKANPDFYGRDVPFLKTPDMHGNMFILATGESLSAQGAASQRSKTLPVGSLCVSCIGTIGVVSITTEPCQTNQQINSLVPTEQAALEFLFFRLKDSKKTLENLGSNGATMGNVNKSKFEALSVLTPPRDLIVRFHEQTAQMFALIGTLDRKNRTLRTTRDLLLPKLISGELDVSAMPEPQALAA